MIDPGKILGGLLGSSGGLGALGNLSGLGGVAKGGSLPTKAAVGMGILGVAMAAFEHFSEKQRVPGSSGATPPAMPGAYGPPPVPGNRGASSVTGVVPPPAPGAVAPSPSPTAAQADPVLLIRAMIAAANADGVFEETERMRILGQLEGVGLTEEEKDFLCAEFNAPRSVQEIVACVSSPAVAAQIYTVSLLTVDVDTPDERAYLRDLRAALGLDEEVSRSIARRLGKEV